MTGVMSVVKDEQALTLTVVAEYDVSAERAWQLFADPRQLERWWGPPVYPATVTDHDLRPGGRVQYFMTGPEGDKHGGFWRVVEVDAPRRLSIEDGFLDDDGNENASMPETRMEVTFTDRPGGVTMTMVSTFPSLETLQQMVDMGMVEGLQFAMSQIPAILAGEASNG